jgi:hypothetical protein
VGEGCPEVKSGRVRSDQSKPFSYCDPKRPQFPEMIFPIENTGKYRHINMPPRMMMRKGSMIAAGESAVFEFSVQVADHRAYTVDYYECSQYMDLSIPQSHPITIFPACRRSFLVMANSIGIMRAWQGLFR